MNKMRREKAVLHAGGFVTQEAEVKAVKRRAMGAAAGAERACDPGSLDAPSRSPYASSKRKREGGNTNPIFVCAQ